MLGKAAYRSGGRDESRRQHGHFFGTARGCISAILFAVPRLVFCSAFFIFVVCSFLGVAQAMPRPQSNQTPSTTPAGGSAPPNQATSAQQALPQQNPSGLIPAPQAHLGPMIVIDPAHGGTDNGAQGPNGTVEKDVVLRLARQIRSDFERQGFRVVLTRNDDSNPSYEDRAALANAYRDAIFISVHVSSTGKVGTAHVYSYQFPSPAASGDAGVSETPKSLITWEEAQRPYLDVSHRLANLLEVELSQRFPGSALISTPFAIRELRSVSAPAIAVELSSISVPDPNMLVAMGAPLSNALVRSVQMLRPGNPLSRNGSSMKTQVAGAN